MRTYSLSALAIAGLVAASTAQAHIGFTGDRTFNSGNPLAAGFSSTVSTRTVGGLYGWADGTDVNHGDSHRETYFRFFLSGATDVSISVSRNDVVTQTGASGALLPGFSLYRIGTGTMPASTHDGATGSINYLTTTFGTAGVAESFTDSNSDGFWNPGEAFTDANGNGAWDSAGLGNSGHEGSFNALGDWQIFSDTGALGDFRYVGNAADGGSANYGSAPGINGDGLADGFVTGTFTALAAGEYFIVVGGATYADQLNFKNSGEYATAGVTYPTYGISVSVSAIPEPSSAVALAGLGAIGFAALRRRRA